MQRPWGEELLRVKSGGLSSTRGLMCDSSTHGAAHKRGPDSRVSESVADRLPFAEVGFLTPILEMRMLSLRPGTGWLSPLWSWIVLLLGLSPPTLTPACPSLLSAQPGEQPQLPRIPLGKGASCPADSQRGPERSQGPSSAASQ